MKKLMLSDLDGTLLGKDKVMSEENRKAINEWTKGGNDFIIATGRLKSAAKYYHDSLGYDTPLVCCNGAVIYNGDEVMTEHSLDASLAKKVWEVSESLNLYCQIYISGKVVANRYEELIVSFDAFGKKHGEKYKIDCRVMKDFDEQSLEGIIHKISFVVRDSTLRAKALEEIGELSGVNVFNSLSYLVDIVPAEASKGSALEYLRNHLGAERTYAIGDNENDIPMVLAADVGAAMGNATEALRGVADVIADCVDDDGLSGFIRDAILD